MKISLGSKIFTGPWGGGNNFIKNLSEYLRNNDFEVYYDLREKDLDFILLTDPRVESESACLFSHYKDFSKSSVIYNGANKNFFFLVLKDTTVLKSLE